eukprot:scaffold82488_cov17-Tisochrysis_lutea.AAC.1
MPESSFRNTHIERTFGLAHQLLWQGSVFRTGRQCSDLQLELAVLDVKDGGLHVVPAEPVQRTGSEWGTNSQ